MFHASDYSTLLNQLERFFADIHPHTPVTHPLSPEELSDRLSLDEFVQGPIHGKPLAELQADIIDYLTHTVKTAHPKYFNQIGRAHV